MKIIHLAGEGSGVTAPSAPFLAAETCPPMSLEAFVDKYSEGWSDVDVFVIDACLSTDGSPADSFGGITLLKLIRLKGLRQHAVVYGSIPLASLMKLGHHEILLSEGTSYKWLTGAVSEEVCRQVKSRIAEEDLSPFFLPEYNELLRMGRHSLANWWGILRMREVLSELGFEKEIPADDGLREALGREDNYQGRLASYIRYHGSPKPVMHIAPGPKQDMRLKVWGVRSRNLKVVFVDDQAADGWSALLRCLLYGKTVDTERKFLVPAIPVEGLDVEALCSEVVSFEPDLVIVDLRLVQDDTGENFGHPTGLSLIRRLREGSAPLCAPILAFTASNKRAVTEEALSLGADGVWTKEGMEESEYKDLGEVPSFSVERVGRLVGELDRLSGYEYSVLYRFMKEIRAIEEASGRFWWESDRWFPADKVERIPLERSVLVGELRKVASSHRQILQSDHASVREGAYDMLTVSLCRVMEFFRSIAKEQNTGFGALGGYFLTQWPPYSRAYALSKYLIDERNTVIHAAPGDRAGISDLPRYEKVMETMVALITEDTSSIRKEKARVGFVCQGKGEDEGLLVFNSKGRFGPIKEIKDGVKVGDSVLAFLREGTETRLRVTTPLFNPGYMKNTMCLKAKYRVTSILPDEIHLDLSAIQYDDRFTVKGPSPDGLKPGAPVYFHMACARIGTAGKRLEVTDVSAELPSAYSATYWSATLNFFSSKGGSKYLSLSRIEPPLGSVFKMAASEWPGGDTPLNGSLAFVPDWSQRNVAVILKKLEAKEEGKKEDEEENHNEIQEPAPSLWRRMISKIKQWVRY